MQNAKSKIIEGGFTLIETIVSLAIFGVVMVVVTAVFVSGLLIQRRAANLQSVQENASFLLETITKEIRVARLLTADTADCTGNPSGTLHFTDQDGNDVIYAKSGTDLTKAINNGAALAINSSSIQFTNLAFCVVGQASGDSRQPRVTMFATVKSISTDQPAAMDIQVTTSQRVLSF